MNTSLVEWILAYWAEEGRGPGTGPTRGTQCMTVVRPETCSPTHRCPKEEKPSRHNMQLSWTKAPHPGSFTVDVGETDCGCISSSTRGFPGYLRDMFASLRSWLPWLPGWMLQPPFPPTPGPLLLRHFIFLHTSYVYHPASFLNPLFFVFPVPLWNVPPIRVEASVLFIPLSQYVFRPVTGMLDLQYVFIIIIHCRMGEILFGDGSIA